MSEQTMQALVISVVDAVGVNPKPDWRRSLLDACDNVEAEYDSRISVADMVNQRTELMESLGECLHAIEIILRKDGSDNGYEFDDFLVGASRVAKERLDRAKEGE